MVGILKNNLENIQNQITFYKAGGDEVMLLAVSKKQSKEKIEELFNLGVQNFGENYLQEALQKQKDLSHLKIDWHFIGQLQSKKIKDIVGQFKLIHTVCRISELEKMNTVAMDKGTQQDYLVQVNVGEEETKQGVLPCDLKEFLSKVKKYGNLNLKGLMFFPPLEENAQEAKEWFKKAYELFASSQEDHPSMQILSMGTSQDYPLAIECGSNLVRIGEVLMGERPQE